MKHAIESGAVPAVSVIMPTYNRVGLIKESVGAVLAQTFTDFELIIVDNMSEDGTREYVAGIGDGRVRYFRNDNKGIIAISRNLGIRNSTGRYVAFCDDDDIWLPDKLEVQTAFMDENKDVGLSFGYAVDFGSGPTVGFLRFPRNETDMIRGYHELFLGNRVATLTVMVQRTCLDDVGLFDEGQAFKNIEDYDLWLRVARKFKLASVGRVIGKYRVHPQAASADEVAEKNKLFKLIEKHRANGWIGDKEARMLESRLNFTIGSSQLARGDARYRGSYLASFRLDGSLRTFAAFVACAMPTGAASMIINFLKSRRRDRVD